MTDYKKIREGHNRVREIYQKMYPELNEQTREKSSIFVYYVDRPFSSKSEDLVGLIIPPKNLSTILQFVFLKNVYGAPSCERIVGIDVEASDPEKVLKYGLNQTKYGKIIVKDDKLLLTQKKLLGVSLMGKGINVIGNIPLVFEELADALKILQ